jgi:hypothetical protein
MPHEYLHSLYLLIDEVIAPLQSIIVVSSQEDYPATDHTHRIAVDTHAITNLACSSKTEVTQVIYSVTPRDRPIPALHQLPIHFSSISERRLSMSIPNNILMV